MNKVKPYLRSSIYIVLGAFIMAVGINVFLAPNKISSGGASTISTILLHLFNLKMSITNIAINALLFGLGFRYLRKDAVIKSAIGIVCLAGFLEATSYIPVYSEDTLLATIVGGLFVGIGIGLVVKQNASTGGSDFGGLVIKRFLPHISIAHIILAIDCTVIIISGIVFKSVTITIYSVIAMYIASKVTDAVSTFGNKAKEVRVLSEKVEEIASVIMEKFDRGATGIHCKGMYSENERLMLLCIVSPKEMPRFISEIKAIDKGAFVIINDVREVLGEGFSSYTDY